MENIVQLNIDHKGWNQLSEIIENYYGKKNRTVYIFSAPLPTDIESIEFSFLIDKKHVVKYSISKSDKQWGGSIGALTFAIGPHYFGPSQFWSYENAERFRMGTDTFDIEQNLRLLDEFLGVAPASPLP